MGANEDLILEHGVPLEGRVEMDMGKYEMGAEELGRLVRGHAEFVQKCMEEPRKGWIPHLMVEAVDWEKGERETHLSVLAMDFNEDEEKRAIMTGLGRKMYGEKKIPVAAVLSSEAWGSKRVNEDPYIRPREDPDREEVIVVMGKVLLGGHAAMMAIPVQREADSTIVLGTPEPLVSEGVECHLLTWFMRGFAENVSEW